MRVLLFVITASLLYCSSFASSPKGGGIQVIGAGLGRTGTLSLAAALEQLGYRPYHYIDFAHSQEWAEWSEFRLDSNEIIDLIVKDGYYNATVENPTSDMYLDLLKRYPNAKVVLTVRDSAEKWEESWKILFDTMEVTERPFSLTFPSFFQFIPLFQHLKQLRCRMGMHLGLNKCQLTRGWRQENKQGWLSQQYEAHSAQVISNVPPENLLVFNVKQGWEPLCEFLNHDIPKDTPFPNASTGINDTESLKRLRVIFLVVVYAWIPVVAFLLLCGWMFIKRCYRGQQRNKDKTN